MKKNNSNNERIKRKYYAFLKEAKQHSEPTIDAAAKALNRFEVYSKFRDFKTFHFDLAIAFKLHLTKQKGQRSGKPLSKSTLLATLTQLKRFFQWLSMHLGISRAFSIPMRSISTYQKKIRELQLQSDSSRHRPWSRSGTLLKVCLQRLKSKNEIALLLHLPYLQERGIAQLPP